MSDTALQPRSGGRQTRPQGYNPYLRGGAGLLARRADDPRLLLARKDLARYAESSPLRLLALLPDVHPAVGLATWNALRLACAPGDLQIVAVQDSAPGEADDTMDPDATAAIADLWESLPQEIGGLQGLQTTLTLSGLFTGLMAVEAVPGRRGSGVSGVWPVDSLTLAFFRDSADSGAIPHQRQTGAPNGFKRLDGPGFFWRALDSFADDPYGRAPYAPAVSEILADLALMQDLRDAVHNAAWPRLQFLFDMKATHEYVVETLGITNRYEVSAKIKELFQEVVTYAQTLRSDDNVVSMGTTGTNVIEGGKSFAALEPILTYLRQRIVQALKTLPTLMGINDGSTQTYTTVEWAIYAAGLETLRGIVAQLLVGVARLHLRLLGLDRKVKAEMQPIRTTDAQMEANAEATRIENEVRKRDEGWQTQDDAARAITGSAAVPEGERYQQPDAPAPAPQDNRNEQRQQNRQNPPQEEPPRNRRTRASADENEDEWLRRVLGEMDAEEDEA